MKKVMPYLCNLYARWSNKRLIRLLALLLALAIPAPVLLRADDDHDRGRFIDPIVGSWIIHIHVATITPSALYHPTSRISPPFGKMVSPLVQIPLKEPLMASGKKWDLVICL